MRSARAGAVALLLSVCACGGGDDDDGSGRPDAGADSGARPGPSIGGEGGYYSTALPILQARCQSCHSAGGAAPFALESRDDVAEVAELVRDAVLERRMPPLPADDRDCRPLSDSRSMPDAEREALVAWLEADMPMDDPEDAPAEPLPTWQSPHDTPLGEPTASADFGQRYRPQTDALDEYRCLVVDPGWDAPRHLRAVGVRPDNLPIVHHVIVYAQLPAQREAVEALDAADEGPGYTCFGGPGFTGARAMGGYVPGAPTRGFAGDTTVTLPADTRFVVQMHYNFLSGSGDDNTQLLFWEVGAPSPTRSSSVLLVNRGFVIPAGDDDYAVTARAPIRDAEPTLTAPLGALQGRPGLAWGVGAHMHTRGKSIAIDLLRANGEEECLLRIPRWDFNWQGQYRFMEPVELFAGDTLRLTCAWDNSPSNQPVVDGERLEPRDIAWGEGTLDEMCLGSVQATAAD